MVEMFPELFFSQMKQPIVLAEASRVLRMVHACRSAGTYREREIGLGDKTR